MARPAFGNDRDGSRSRIVVDKEARGGLEAYGRKKFGCAEVEPWVSAGEGGKARRVADGGKTENRSPGCSRSLVRMLGRGRFSPVDRIAGHKTRGRDQRGCRLSSVPGLGSRNDTGRQRREDRRQPELPSHSRRPSVSECYWVIELATCENTLLAFPPIKRMVPTTMTRITASITAYSAIS